MNQENAVRIFGSEGRILVPHPWVDSYSIPQPGQIIIEKNGDIAPQEITIPASATSFTYEADVFGETVAAGQTQAPSPAMTWADSLGNMRTLDTWRARRRCNKGINCELTAEAAVFPTVECEVHPTGHFPIANAVVLPWRSKSRSALPP